MPLETLIVDDYDLPRFVERVRAGSPEPCGYVVTPNVDHLIRLDESEAFRAMYADAAFVLLDSRVVARTLRLFGGPPLPVCPGSDLTAALFAQVIAPDDRVVIIGSRPAQVRRLAERHGLRGLVHHDPPMGFVHDPAALEAAVAFAEAHSPFRFCLVAVGAPQQETVAQLLKRRGRARGWVLCIGASIDFLTGVEQRAPKLLQRLGLEWLFRLLQSPRRLARRYLVRGPKVFSLLRRVEVSLRPAR